jgi:hypothetical protein
MYAAADFFGCGPPSWGGSLSTCARVAFTSCCALGRRLGAAWAQVENIRAVYGARIAQELLEVCRPGSLPFLLPSRGSEDGLSFPNPEIPV